MRISLTRPDDWHLHLRDGAQLASVVAHSASQFARAIVMPNLKPPVESVEQALAYRERVLAACAGSAFEPLMTLYLTPSTTPALVRSAAATPFIHGIKLYPAGATTNSEFGVADLDAMNPVFEALVETGLPLLVHGESIEREVDVFDREARFIERTLAPLLERFIELRVVFEHITTREAVDFVLGARPGVGATITAHHLLYDRNDLFRGGIRPDLYCLPVLKRRQHREALLDAIRSGSERFFLGTDSAPHPRNAKHAACGCAGIYTAHAAMPLYAEAFEQAGALDRLEAFASFNGPTFYGLPRNTGTLTLEKQDAQDPHAWQVPREYRFGDDVLTPLRAGETLAWRVVV